MRALDADRVGGARRPDARRHTTLSQSWIQRENWEFETHTGLDTIVRNRAVAQQERVRERLRDVREALVCAVAARKRPMSGRLAAA